MSSGISNWRLSAIIIIPVNIKIKCILKTPEKQSHQEKSMNQINDFAILYSVYHVQYILCIVYLEMQLIKLVNLLFYFIFKGGSLQNMCLV